MSGYDASTNALKRRIKSEQALGEVARLRDALAAARAQVEAMQAELAAVRKVEEWRGGLTGRHIVQCADGRFVAAHYPAQQTAGAERIAAGPLDFVSLGRALAAQEEDHA